MTNMLYCFSLRNFIIFFLPFPFLRPPTSPAPPTPPPPKKKESGKTSYNIANKVSLQTSLERNPSNSSYIFILSVNFENLTVELNALIISFMHAKCQEDQKSIAMSSNKC